MRAIAKLESRAPLRGRWPTPPVIREAAGAVDLHGAASQPTGCAGRCRHAWLEQTMNATCAKKAPRREGRRGAKQRAWAGGQIKRAEQLKHGCPNLVPLQTNFFEKILRATTDPFLGQPDAIAAGRVTYAGKCYVRHHSSGAREPNLFATKLSDQRFLETVIQGRKGTQMPAFGLRCRRRLDRKRPGVCQLLWRKRAARRLVSAAIGS